MLPSPDDCLPSLAFLILSRRRMLTNEKLVEPQSVSTEDVTHHSIPYSKLLERMAMSNLKACRLPKPTFECTLRPKHGIPDSLHNLNGEIDTLIHYSFNHHPDYHLIRLYGAEGLLHALFMAHGSHCTTSTSTISGLSPSELGVNLNTFFFI